MSNRHLSRSIVLQSLFEKDFNDLDEAQLKKVLNRNIEEFGGGIEDTRFIENLTSGILKNQKKLDAVIEKAAPERPIEQMAPVDRNVLRIGLYELIFGDKKDVPPRVAINEAIELAKTFGGESSGKFVNGVLGTVFNEMGGEEYFGKDSIGGKKKEIVERLAGAVVYRKENDNFYFAMVHDVFGYWTLSKGHLDEKESLKEAVKREIKEEMNLSIEVEDEIGSNEYIAYDPEKGKIRKNVTYFLAKTEDKEIVLKSSGGLDGAKWFKMKDLGDLKIYEDVKPIIARGIKKLLSPKNNL